MQVRDPGCRRRSVLSGCIRAATRPDSATTMARGPRLLSSRSAATAREPVPQPVAVAVQSMVHELDSRVEIPSDAEIVVGLARIVASLESATGIRASTFQPGAGFHFLPVSFYQYPTVFSVACNPRQRGSRRARVISIGGTPAAMAFKTIREIAPADNAMSRQSFGADPRFQRCARGGARARRRVRSRSRSRTPAVCGGPWQSRRSPHSTTSIGLT